MSCVVHIWQRFGHWGGAREAAQFAIALTGITVGWPAQLRTSDAALFVQTTGVRAHTTKGLVKG